MRARRFLVATLVSTALATGAIAQTATAAPSAGAASTKFCNAFSENYQIGILVALAAAFGTIGDGDDAATSKEIRETMLFVLSPKLADLTSRLAKEASDRQLGRTFRRQSRAFAKAVEGLRDAGVPDKAIDALAKLDLDADADQEDIIGKAKISEAKLERAAQQWAKRYGDDLAPDDLPASVQTAFAAAGSECGVFPDQSLTCDDLVDEADAEAIIGPIVGTEHEPGTCRFESGPNADGDTNELKVDVYASPEPFDERTKEARNQDVPDLGDEAVALEGLSGFSDLDFSTCGTTLVVRDGDRTVLVGACVRDGDVDITQLTDLAQKVLENLS